MLVLGNPAFSFITANLLIQCIEKLLAGGSAGKCGAMVERSAKTAKIEQPFGRAVKRYAHAVQQIDDSWRGLTHGLDRRLIGEKIAAVDRVIKMLPGGIAFALEVLGCVDAALSAY